MLLKRKFKRSSNQHCMKSLITKLSTLEEKDDLGTEVEKRKKCIVGTNIQSHSMTSPNMKKVANGVKLKEIK